MIGEDIMGKVFSCMGQKDDAVAKGLLAGKVRGELLTPCSLLLSFASRVRFRLIFFRSTHLNSTSFLAW